MRAPTLLVATLVAGSAAGLFLVCPTAADAQSIAVEKASCVPMEENGLIRGTVGSTAPGLAPRLYFRWKDHEDFYWVSFEPEAGNRFWAIPPKPERRNDHIEYYSALVDPAGKVAARSESQITPVTKDCRVPLDARQRGVAQNLTVGETSPQQQGKKVLAFLCDGVVTRVNSAGVRRSDEVCRACVIAWWGPKAMLVPAAIAGIGGVIVTDQAPEPSPSRPPSF
jgi:hypothetical protein